MIHSIFSFHGKSVYKFSFDRRKPFTNVFLLIFCFSFSVFRSTFFGSFSLVGKLASSTPGALTSFFL